MWRLLKVGLVAVGISLGAVPADAQLQCAHRSELITRLDQGFDEKLTGVGVTSNGLLLEVFASNDGSWTVLDTRPNGHSCIVSHGTDWHGFAASSSGQIS